MVRRHTTYLAVKCIYCTYPIYLVGTLNIGGYKYYSVLFLSVLEISEYLIQ